MNCVVTKGKEMRGRAVSILHTKEYISVSTNLAGTGLLGHM